MPTERLKLAVDCTKWGSGSALTALGALVELRGVVSAEVNVAAESASLEYDPTEVQLIDLARAVEEVWLMVSREAPR